MCVVSMVVDYGMRTWPKPEYATPDEWYIYKDLIRKAKQTDQDLGQPDCVDPKKDEWIKDMDERMKRIEEKLDKLATGYLDY